MYNKDLVSFLSPLLGIIHLSILYDGIDFVSLYNWHGMCCLHRNGNLHVYTCSKMHTYEYSSRMVPMTSLLAFLSLCTTTSALTTRSLPIFEPFVHTFAVFRTTNQLKHHSHSYTIGELLKEEVVEKLIKLKAYSQWYFN